AIKALQLRPADYTKVDAAIAAAKKLDRSHYQDLSGVDAALAAVNRNLNITQQAQADTMAAKITAAIAALVLKPGPQPD
ncbi:lacto-N-biosidase, partial [Lacticaseibacillus paracasei]